MSAAQTGPDPQPSATGADTPVRWGIFGAAGIALNKVIPAMQRAAGVEVVALASRDERRAREAAESLGIPRGHGSYEALLEDPDVEAVYIPLPNHLHVPWSERAAEAGKHVLCEKPLGLSAADASRLLAVRERTGVRIGEAFMVLLHPQWREARRLVAEGEIGELRLVSGHFSYFKRDANNIRSRLEYGGGALMDIGCYPVLLSRWVFGDEPTRVVALMERDPDLRVDRLTSAMLEFPAGQCTFTCSMQLVPFQRMEILGTRGRIQLEIPFNAPPDRPTRMVVDSGRELGGAGARIMEVEPVDQYALQAEQFSRAIRGRGDVPIPLEDSIRNMAVLDALFRSAETGRWEAPRADPAS